MPTSTTSKSASKNASSRTKKNVTSSKSRKSKDSKASDKTKREKDTSAQRVPTKVTDFSSSTDSKAAEAKRRAAAAKQKGIPKAKKREIYEFQQEISGLMQFFGDSPNTVAESVKFVEGVARSHVCQIYRQAQLHAQQREKFAKTAIDDILFQIRNDLPRANRMYNFLVLHNRAPPRTVAAVVPGTALEGRKRKRPRSIGWDWVVPSLLENEDEKDFPHDPMDPYDFYLRTGKNIFEDATCRMSYKHISKYMPTRGPTILCKKPKKLQSWVGADAISEEVAYCLAYLAWEYVAFIVQAAIQVQETMPLAMDPDLKEARVAIGVPVKRRRVVNAAPISTVYDSFPDVTSMPKARSPLLPIYYREAFRRSRTSVRSTASFSFR